MTPLTVGLLRTMPLPGHEGEIDKDERGRVLCVGGSTEIPGALILAGEASLRAGAGKLQIAAPESVAQRLALAVPEARVIGLTETDGEISVSAADRVGALAARSDAVVVGPGMMDDASATALASAVMACDGDAALLFDAAAICHLRSLAKACRRCEGRLVITPHAGEMAALTGMTEEEVVADPAGYATRAAADLGAVVVMKGGTTHVAAPDGALWRFDGGCIGLATSGSGDVLAGIIGGLLARGADVLTATLWGIHLHGAAGNRLTVRHGPVGFLARELPAEVPAIMAELS